MKVATPLCFTLGIIIWYLLISLKEIDLSEFMIALKEAPAAAGYLSIICGVFAKWGWSFRIFQRWLVLVPDLNGTWEGELQTNWKDPKTGQTPGPIDTILVIRQSLFQISCVQMTKESKSWSRTASISIDQDNHLKLLEYLYSNQPKPSVNDRSKNHDGACSLEIIIGPTKKLIGKYWTDRNAQGELNLIFKDRTHKQEFVIFTK